ncbi:protein kinase [Patescibacteria group bacterium]|nr:protein kinase [Patescibacteria group bacterium]
MKHSSQSSFIGFVIPLGTRQIQIEEQLAFGNSQTTLLKGVDKATGEVFGIKHYDFSRNNRKQVEKRFWREAQSLFSLSSHPSFLSFSASTCFLDSSFPAGWIVMELAQGGTLAQLFKLMKRQEERHEKKMPLLTIASFMEALLEGIVRLEEVEMIHCVLNPEKILLCCPSEAPLQFCSGKTSVLSGKNIRISGLSNLKTVPELKSLPPSANLHGLYAAPEEVSSLEPQKRALYSLGLILYELIMGKLPEPLLDILNDSSPSTVKNKALHEVKQRTECFDFPLGQIEVEKEALLHNFVRGLTQKDPKKRISSKAAVNLLNKLKTSLSAESGNNPLAETMHMEFDPSRVAVVDENIEKK